MFSLNSGVRTYERCKLKEVTDVQSGERNTYVQVFSYLFCPAVEDSGNKISTTALKRSYRYDKAARESRKNLAQLCGTTLCKSCIYKNTENESEVEIIRQNQAKIDIEVSREKKRIAEAQLAALNAEAEAIAADLHLRDAIDPSGGNTDNQE